LFCRDVPKGSGNIETLIEITNAKHFQAAAMLSTGLFELAVDIRLLDRVPHATEKMIVSVEVEKLRCARKAVAFGTTNLGAKVDTIFESFIREKGSGIDAKHRRLWPNKEQSEKLRIVRHWSGLDLNARVRLLEEPFNRIYVLEYPKMSWYVHPGLTGVVNVNTEAFTLICSSAFKLPADAYWEVLKAVIQKFKIEKANEQIHRKMKVAQLLPFTDDPDQENALLESIA
jgi:hypothetical protein